MNSLSMNYALTRKRDLGTEKGRSVPSTALVETPRPPGRVLIVDDEPILIRVTQLILQRHGYETLTAASGRAAIELVERCPDAIDLVLLDVMMPEMNGFETFERLRLLRPHLPVLFCSAYIDDAVGLAPKDANVRFLAKPYRSDALVAAVAEWRPR